MKRLAAISVCLVCFTLPVLADEKSNGTGPHDVASSASVDTAGKTSRFISAATTPGSALQFTPGNNMAGDIANTFAPQFGVNANNLRTKKIKTTPNKGQVIRYQQQHKGIDIIGAEIIANVNASNTLTSISGETSTKLNVATQFQVSAIAAQATAVSAIAKWYGLAEVELYVTTPVLKIYDPRLFTPFQTNPELVWEMEVLPTDIKPIRQYVLVNAINGYITLNFNKTDTALDLSTHTAGGTAILPGAFVCDETDLTCAAGDADAKSAHDFAADTYNFYFTNHGRDSIDNAGMQIVSTVHFYVNLCGPGVPDANCPFENAFWSGSQMVYSDNFSLSDDVVAHEITHGITERESNLVYYFQSGAINESFSDIWGEFIDQTNGKGTDTPAVIWLVGEDLPSIGAVRSMSDPTVFNDPDRMKSPYYAPDNNLGDNGGVHINSGIGNKAAFLITDGGSFNGYTITGLGITKAAKIYYEAQTNLLTTGADYNDLYNALNQACSNLTGNAGITAGDCAEVNKALLAVEMNQSPNTVSFPGAIQCTAGENQTTLIFDDFETAVNPNWITGANIGSNQWSAYSQGALKYGAGSAYGVNADSRTDTSLKLSNSIKIPSTYTYMYFDHLFAFETDPGNGTGYDGGIIEYSTNGGSSWNDAGSLLDSGQKYTGTIATTPYDNPLQGRNGFIGGSNAYVSSRLALTSLAGQNVLLRFRIGTDISVSSLGWSIDNLRIYTCTQTIQQPPIANAGADITVNEGSIATLFGAGSIDPNGDAINYSWVQTSGPTVSLSNSNTATPSFTAPAGPSTAIFRLDINDGNGGTDSDSVTVNINALPNPPDDSGGCSVNKNADFDPIWLLLLSILIIFRQYRFHRCK